jgi:hypothetical protein
LRPSRVEFVFIGDPDYKEASMTAPPTALPTRQLQIDFLFLDLETCTRCRATDATLLDAIERTRPALDAAGVAVSVTKTLVASEAHARELGFVSSPTIRINGVDVAGELVQSACDTCSQEPPVGLIVEAIMRHASGVDHGAAAVPPPGSGTVPANLRRYFAAAAGQATECCTAEEHAGCCGPEHKAACCGNGVAASSCGCQA